MACEHGPAPVPGGEGYGNFPRRSLAIQRYASPELVQKVLQKYDVVLGLCVWRLNWHEHCHALPVRRDIEVRTAHDTAVREFALRPDSRLIRVEGIAL